MVLAELRMKKGYNQAQLSKKLGLSRSAVNKWETGAAKPRFTLIGKLAKELGVSEQDILDCFK